MPRWPPTEPSRSRDYSRGVNPIFAFTAELFSSGAGSWVFVAVPVEDSEEIKDLIPDRQGFGSVKVRACLGSIAWATSLFPDKASGCYFLPLKKATRERVGVGVGDEVNIEVEVLLN
jgi:hypothetical protein